jgi:hypothetical protein
MLTDTSYRVYHQNIKSKTISLFYRNNPCVSMDYDTYLSRQIGSELCCYPGSVFVPAPVFPISCSDSMSQVLPSIPSTTYILAPTSVGVGVALVQCFNAQMTALSITVINTTSTTLMPVPPSGTTSIQYEFRCTPAIVPITCSSSGATDTWRPLQFQNTESFTIQLVFTPNTVPSIYIDPGFTSSTIVGITSYSANCSQTNYVYASSPDPSVQNPVPSGATVQIQNTIPGGGANTLGIQFYNSSNTLLETVEVDNGTTKLFVVPSTATYFTAIACYLYTLPNPAYDNQIVAYNGAPLLFVNTNILSGSQTIRVQYHDVNGFYLGDGPLFTSSSSQIVVVNSAPGNTNYLELKVQA